MHLISSDPTILLPKPQNANDNWYLWSSPSNGSEEVFKLFSLIPFYSNYSLRFLQVLCERHSFWHFKTRFEWITRSWVKYRKIKAADIVHVNGILCRSWLQKMYKLKFTYSEWASILTYRTLKAIWYLLSSHYISVKQSTDASSEKQRKKIAWKL